MRSQSPPTPFPRRPHPPAPPAPRNPGLGDPTRGMHYLSGDAPGGGGGGRVGEGGLFLE